MEIRNKEILNLYGKGIKLAEIGRKFGISRQRVWEIVKKDYQYNNTGKKPRCMIKRPIKSEEFVHNKLIKLGIKFEICGYNEYYDLDINGKKVEIKQRSHSVKVKSNLKKNPKVLKPIKSDGYYYYYKFNFLKPKYPIDYFIFVCGKLDKNTKCYIYPASKIKNNINIHEKMIRSKSVQEEYLENWGQLK